MPKQFRFPAVAISVILFIAIYLPALFPSQAEILPVKTYTTADGLPRDSVWKVRQDARGFLWFCTSEGLVRFDGYGFKLYDKEDGLPLRGVADFLQARNGVYWLGTKAGLVRFNPNGVRGQAQQANRDQAMFTVVEMESPPPQPRYGREVNYIYEDPQGTIWVAMEDGLNKLVEEQGRTILRRVDLPYRNKLGYLPTHYVMKDSRGSLWVSAEHGPQESYSTLYRILPDGQGEKLERYNIQKGTVGSMLETPDGTFWAGFGGHSVGLCKLVAQPQEGQEILSQCFGKKEGLPSGWIMSLRQASDGTIWIGTAGGAARFRPDFAGDKPDFETFRESQGVCDREVMDVNEDHDGNLWFSTSCGATKFARNGFTRFTEADGLNAPSVFTILNDRSGRLIVIISDASRNLMLNVFDGRRFTQIEPNTPPGTNHGWGWGQIVINSWAGDWWFPTEEGILYRFANITAVNQLARAKPRAYTAKEGFTDQMVGRMYEDTRGDVWVSSSYKDKTLRWDHRTDQINDLSAASENPKNTTFPTSYAEDLAGNLWMGSAKKADSRLIRYRNDQFKVFTQADGLPVNDVTDNLMVDSKGRLWFGTNANGVGRIDDPTAEPLKITWYNRTNGLSTNRASSLVEDQWGRIYISTGRGVDCLNPETGQVRSFTTADGLPKGEIRISTRDAQGTLWFGNPLGVARYVPEPPRSNQPPTIFLSGLRVAGVAQQVSEIGELNLSPLKLNPSQTNVTLEFLSPSATADPHIRYQYKLEGRADWSAPTDQRSVDFANLAAGSYRFLVQAVNADGIPSATPASVSFTVAAPVWQRWWFILLTAGALGGLGYAAYRYRVAQLLALERMRTRIATDLHDEVGSSLSQIAILSEVARLRLTRDGGAPKDPATISSAMEPMENIAVTSREAVDAMSDIVWAINPQRDQLSDLSQRMRLFASDTLTARDIQLRFHAPEQDLSLDAEVRRQVFLLFKECVNNIVRHANCTEVEVEFALTDHHLSLRVWDNGHGFVESKPQPGQNGGNGLLSMRRRASELGGRLEVISGNGDGTTVKLEAPLRPRRR